MASNSGGERAALVPSGARTPPAYQCLRSLGRRGIHTVYGSKYDSDATTFSRYCDESVSLVLPSENLLAYRDQLLELADRPDVRTIVPTSEYEAYLLSKFRDEFENRVSLAVPSFESLRRVHDRVRLAEAAEAAGVTVPRTLPFDEVDDWDDDLVVKSRYNLVTSDYVASCPAGETSIVKDVSYLRPGEIPDPESTAFELNRTSIGQEFVPRSAEYMVGALCRHGELLATVQLHQVREDSYLGGGGVYRKSVRIPRLAAATADLLAELDWHGLACVEYIEDAETGEFALVEINPRIWQSIAPSVRAGVDFPYYYWLLATGRPDLIDPDPEVGVGSHFLRGELNHLQSVFGAGAALIERPNPYVRTAEVLASFVAEPRFDTLRFDDPSPFVRGVLSGLRARIRSFLDEGPSHYADESAK